MSAYFSPLRYPGGKTSLLAYLVKIIELNRPIETYIEPYAGGAGAALGLLFKGYVEKIILNEYDEAIYKFWHAILHNTEDFLKKIRNVRININVWKRQKKLLNNYYLNEKIPKLKIAFAMFYLNRCNRSGILEAGPIGGKSQLSEWRIDARFNKKGLTQRIKKIAIYKNKIKLFNLDAIDFMKNHLTNLNLRFQRTLIYLDPPYFEKGHKLYRHYYKEQDHKELQKFLKNEIKAKWVLSYDDVPFINHLYNNTNKNEISMNHFAFKAKIGKELIIASDNCALPERR